MKMIHPFLSQNKKFLIKHAKEKKWQYMTFGGVSRGAIARI
jgi:hypothetical protein